MSFKRCEIHARLDAMQCKGNLLLRGWQST